MDKDKPIDNINKSGLDALIEPYNFQTINSPLILDDNKFLFLICIARVYVFGKFDKFYETLSVENKKYIDDIKYLVDKNKIILNIEMDFDTTEEDFYILGDMQNHIINYIVRSEILGHKIPKDILFMELLRLAKHHITDIISYDSKYNLQNLDKKLSQFTLKQKNELISLIFRCSDEDCLNKEQCSYENLLTQINQNTVIDLTNSILPVCVINQLIKDMMLYLVNNNINQRNIILFYVFCNIDKKVTITYQNISVIYDGNRLARNNKKLPITRINDKTYVPVNLTITHMPKFHSTSSVLTEKSEDCMSSPVQEEDEWNIIQHPVYTLQITIDHVLVLNKKIMYFNEQFYVKNKKK